MIWELESILFREFPTLQDAQAEILIKLHRQHHPSVSELIRGLRMGGETFYRHKKILVDAGLVKEVVIRSSRMRTVSLELTEKGIEVAILLEKLASVLNETD